MKKGDLGIDLGTASLLVFQKGKDIVIDEPSVIAVELKTGKIIAIGSEAKEMIGKTPKDIKAVRPIRDGVIADYQIIEQALKELVRRTRTKFSLSRPAVVVGVPAKVTSVERRAVIEATTAAGASRVYLVLEPIVAAVGAGLHIFDSVGNMVVDIGGGTSDIAVISLGGIVVSRSLRTAGDAMDDAIIKFVKRKYKFIIGSSTAEDVKIKIGKAFPTLESYELEVRGRDALNGLPGNIRITSDDVHEAISQILQDIVLSLRQILEDTPPEIAADIMDTGIVLTGGGSLLRGLPDLIIQETGIKTIVSEDPRTCVVKGIGELLDSDKRLQRVAINHNK
jgi:rod shape-determining protein MreB